MVDEGLIDGRKSVFYCMGGVLCVIVLCVVDIEDGEVLVIFESW